MKNPQIEPKNQKPVIAVAERASENNAAGSVRPGQATGINPSPVGLDRDTVANLRNANWPIEMQMMMDMAAAGIRRRLSQPRQAKAGESKRPVIAKNPAQPRPFETTVESSASSTSTAEVSTNSTNSTSPARFEFEAAIYPPNSLLEDYVNHAREQLESADSYIVGSILPIIATCLGRRVSFPLGTQRVYPNIFALAAGRAGERKSSAINLAEKFAKFALPPESFLPALCSSESLFDEYYRESGGAPDKLLLIDDANVLLGTWSGSGYGQRVSHQFLRLYDCKDLSESFRRNKSEANGSGRKFVKETSTSVLLGATLDVCRLQGRGISSGLQRRFLFYAAEKHGRFIPTPPVPDPAELDWLNAHFQKLCKLEVACSFSKPALRVWEEYQRFNRERLQQAGSEAISARLNGAPCAVLKIAMLFEAACWVIAENEWNGIIRPDTLKLAIAHVDHCLETATKLDDLADRETTDASAESLLARIRRDFEVDQERGVIVLTKSQLTAKYAPHPSRPHACKPADLYERLIPFLVAKGLARLGGKEGKKVWYEFAKDDVSNLSNLSNLSK